VAKKGSVLERRVSIIAITKNGRNRCLRSSHISPFVSWERALARGNNRGGLGKKKRKNPTPFFLLLSFFAPQNQTPGSRKRKKEERKRREKKNVSPPPSAPLLSDDEERVRGGVLNVVLKFEPKNSFKTPRMRGHI